MGLIGLIIVCSCVLSLNYLVKMVLQTVDVTGRETCKHKKTKTSFKKLFFEV